MANINSLLYTHSGDRATLLFISELCTKWTFPPPSCGLVSTWHPEHVGAVVGFLEGHCCRQQWHQACHTAQQKKHVHGSESGLTCPSKMTPQKQHGHAQVSMLKLTWTPSVSIEFNQGSGYQGQRWSGQVLSTWHFNPCPSPPLITSSWSLAAEYHHVL